MDKRKKIGIVGWDTGPNSFGITMAYLNYFMEFGDVVVIGINDDIDTTLDLLVLPGGADVSTARYGCKPSIFTGKANTYLEYFDTQLLPKYVENKTPIVGICRGLQSINVFFGGTLKQNLMFHPYSDKDNRAELVHDVAILVENPTAPYTTIISADASISTFSVNSLHHQAIKDLGKDIIPTLRHCDINKKGSISFPSMEVVFEGIKHKTLPIAAFQYHPKFFGAY